MWRHIWLAVLAVGCGGGGVDPNDLDDDGAWTGFSTPGGANDAIDPATGERAPQDAWTLFAAIDSSIHELVTCGGAQRSLVAPMGMRVLLGADGLFEPEALGDLTETLSYLTSAQADFSFDAGVWKLPMGTRLGGQFEVRFLDPLTEDLVTDNVFELDSYVRGATAASSRTWEEMMNDGDYDVVDTFTFTWEEEGPLAHLLDPLTNPIVVQGRIGELVPLLVGWSGFGEPDLGSFASLYGVTVEGSIPFDDTAYGAAIHYDATIGPAPMRDLMNGGSAAVRIEGMSATYAGWSTRTLRVDLRDVDYGLAGEIVFALDGPRGQQWQVQFDFGTGRPYPETRWQCIYGC